MGGGEGGEGEEERGVGGKVRMRVIFLLAWRCIWFSALLLVLLYIPCDQTSTPEKEFRQ